MAAATKKCPECKSQLAADLRNCPNCPHSFPESPDEASSDMATGQSWSPIPMILMLALAAAGGGLWKVFLQVGTDPGSVMSETSMIGEQGVKKKSLPAAAPDGHWLFRGLVRDLVTLSPVKGARLSFRGASGAVETSPDELGVYSVTVPAGAPYRVVITAKGYASTYLNPGMEGVAELDAERRAELAGELRAASLPPYEVQGYDTQPVPVDFFLAPAR